MPEYILQHHGTVIDKGSYGVCEAWSTELIPMVPRLDVVVSDVVLAQRSDLPAVTEWSRGLRDRFHVEAVDSRR